MSNDSNILIIDNEPSCQAWLHHLSKQGYQVTCISTLEDAAKLMRRTPYHVLVMYYYGDNNERTIFVQEMARKYPRCQIIMTFSQTQMSMIAEALNLGAYDYLIDALHDPPVAVAAVDRAIEKSKLIAENRLLSEKVRLNAEGLENVTSKLARLATIDDITNLHNQKHFNNALNMEFSRSQRYGHTFSILIVDLVTFSQYTNIYGQKAGDLLLYSVAQILNGATRVSDTLVRNGDSEFAVLLPETDEPGAKLLLHRIETQVSAHPFPGRESLPDKKLTVRIGMATYPVHGDEIDALMLHAREALKSTATPENTPAKG